MAKPRLYEEIKKRLADGEQFDYYKLSPEELEAIDQLLLEARQKSEPGPK